MALNFSITALRITNDFLPTAGGGKTNSSSDSSIGVPMVMEADIELDSPDTVEDVNWSFSPALFIGPTVPASSGVAYFKAYTPPGTTSGDALHMDLFTDNAFVNTQRNFRASLLITGSQTATVRLTFRMTMDVSGYLSQNELRNWERFTKPHFQAPGFANTMASVYRNTDRRISFKLKIQNAADEVLQKFYHAPFASRYYSRGLPTALTEPPTGTDAPDAEFLPGFNVVMKRGGVEVDGLSAYTDTEVNLYFEQGTDFTLQDKALVYLLKLNQPNSGYFLDDYGSRGSIFTSAATDGQDLNYGIIGMSDAITTEVVESVTMNRVRFKVQASYLDASATYALLMVVGGAPVADADQTFTNSFFWKPEGLVANQLPEPVDMAGKITGVIEDYNKEATTDYVVTTVVDRLISTVEVDASTYNGSTAFATLWETDVRNLQLRFEDVDTNEVLWTTSYERQGDRFVNVEGDTGNSIEIEESGTTHTYRALLNMCYPNGALLPDFSGKTIRVVWCFLASYPALEWTVRYEYPQVLTVMGYQSFAGVIKSITLREYETGLPVQNLCLTDQVLVEVLLDPDQVGTDTWNIRAYWSLEAHGYQRNTEGRPGATREEEAYEGATGNLPQLDDVSIINLPAEFDGTNRAVFVFDHALVPIGQRARIHVIAEPVDVFEDCCSCEHLSVSGTDYPDANSTYEIFDTPVGGYPARRNSFGNYIYWEPGGGSYWLLGTAGGNFLAPPEYASPCLVPRNEWYPDPGNPASGPLPIVCGGIIQSVRVVVDGVIDAVFDFVDVMNSRPALGYDDSGNTWGLVYTGADWAVYDTVNGYVFTNPSDVILPKDITGTWTAIGTAGPVPELFNMPCDY